MFAATGSADLARLLLDLLIVLTAAKLAAELAERARIPAVLGEIVAGVVIGPSGLGLVELGGDRGISLAVLAEIGVLLLLLSVGMEMDLVELRKVGGVSMAVAVTGVVVPFAAGTGIGLLFGESTNTAIFFGAALTATSVGITARVFGDLRALASVEARIVLGAAVADDVLGLIILTVVVKMVTGGSVGVGTVAQTLGLAVAFLVGTGLLGILVVPKVFGVIHRRATSSATLVVAAFALMMAFAALADVAKLAFIIGAFMAGLALGQTEQHERIANDLGAVGNIFIPVFFLSIGINADLAAMAKPSVIGLAVAMSAVAVAGKMVSALSVPRGRADRVLIGLGMIPRGEVGLIFASIGLSKGVLDGDQYGALLIVVLVTTVLTPPLLRTRLGRAPTADHGAELFVATEEPDGGWLTVDDGIIGFAATPPASATIQVALATAHQAATARPAEPVLDWFARHRRHEITWTAADTPKLVELLREDVPRSWRFLDVTGVLDRSLPEVATAMSRRRADMTDLDPLGSLRFPVVDRLHDLTLTNEPDMLLARTDSNDELVLAAFVTDVCLDSESISSLAQRLSNDVDAVRITSIVADANLLRTRAHDPAGFDDNEILQMATHLATPTHARHAYLLALAFGDLSPIHRDALDSQYRQVQEALDHPELTGGDALNLAGARRLAAQHLLTDPAPIDRLRFASTTYLLAHDPEELARQAHLVEPLPRAGVVRVAVSPEPEPDHWKIDVACRDTDGLLARLADVLTNEGTDIVGADVATWPDTAVLCSFIVRSGERPGARSLGEAFQLRLRTAVHTSARPSLELTFDNHALPWLTVCTVTGPDEPGALQAVSSAFASSGAVIHSARIASADGQVNDRFAVSDRFNRKLGDPAIERMRATLATGGHRRRSRRQRRN